MHDYEIQRHRERHRELIAESETYRLAQAARLRPARRWWPVMYSYARWLYNALQPQITRGAARALKPEV